MRSLLLFACLTPGIIFTSCTNDVPVTVPVSAAESEQIMNDFFTALSTSDTTLLTSITSDNMVMFEHEEIWSRDSLLALMPLTGGRIWEIQDIEVVSEGDISHVHYYNLSRKPEGRSWLESALLVRQNDQLKIQFMHSTKLYLKNE